MEILQIVLTAAYTNGFGLPELVPAEFGGTADA